MAVYTPLSPPDAARIADAHGLGELRSVDPIAAGSVNSNFFLETERGRFFCRLYEEQQTDGVAYEWALLDHLCAHGLPVPVRIDARDPAPGAVRASGKCVAVFECVAGQSSCQRAVSPRRLRAVGALLADLHLATRSFGWRRRSRFDPATLPARLDDAAREVPVDHTGRSTAPAIAALREALAQVEAALPAGLPSAVVHGDLFRDNVLFEGDTLVAAIDWESAATGPCVFDLAVTTLAWCFGDGFEPALRDALLQGYEARRPLSDDEREALPVYARLACVRFATTRLTDFERRAEPGTPPAKDYRRFLMRLEEAERW